MKIKENWELRYIEGVVKEIGKVVGRGKRIYMDYNESENLIDEERDEIIEELGIKGNK